MDPMSPETSRPWGEQLWGTKPNPIDRDLWLLAWHSYGEDPPFADVPWDRSSQPELPAHWRRVPDQELAPFGLSASSVDDPDTGFRAMVFEDTLGHAALAFRGSNDGPDWTANAEQALGRDTPQYRHAMDVAVDLVAAVGVNVAFTGHSLGGGLASAAALATGRVAVTFDAAGLHPHTAAEAVACRDDRVDLDEALDQAATGQIRAYHTDVDMLTALQQSHLGQVPKALGTEIVLKVPENRARQRWHQVGERMGPALGGVVGGLTTGSPAGAGVGAVVGGAVGGKVATGLFGHFYHSVDEAMAALFDESEADSAVDGPKADPASVL